MLRDSLAEVAVLTSPFAVHCVGLLHNRASGPGASLAQLGLSCMRPWLSLPLHGDHQGLRLCPTHLSQLQDGSVCMHVAKRVDSGCGGVSIEATALSPSTFSHYCSGPE